MNCVNSRVHAYFAALALLCLASLQGAAQAGRGPGPHHRMSNPMYNPGTEVMVNGVVTEVEQLTGPGTAAGQSFAKCPRGWTGTHLILQTDTGTLAVHVGPASYLASKNFSVQKDDRLTIVGSKVQYEGSDFLIAKEIRKGFQTLQLRDNRGFPMWSGYRRGTPMPNPAAAN